MNLLAFLHRFKRRRKRAPRPHKCSRGKPVYLVQDYRPGPCVWVWVIDEVGFIHFNMVYWLN